jgi:hypothetical protein
MMGVHQPQPQLFSLGTACPASANGWGALGSGCITSGFGQQAFQFRPRSLFTPCFSGYCAHTE